MQGLPQGKLRAESRPALEVLLGLGVGQTWVRSGSASSCLCGFGQVP